MNKKGMELRRLSKASRPLRVADSMPDLSLMVQIEIAMLTCGLPYFIFAASGYAILYPCQDEFYPLRLAEKAKAQRSSLKAYRELPLPQVTHDLALRLMRRGRLLSRFSLFQLLIQISTTIVQNQPDFQVFEMQLRRLLELPHISLLRRQAFLQWWDHCGSLHKSFPGAYGNGPWSIVAG